MVSNTSPSFSDVVIIGERVENCVKAGTIQGVAGPSNSNGNGKKLYSGFVKKKEAYAAALPQPWVAPQQPFVPQQQVAAPQNRQQNPRTQGQRAPQRQRYPERRIDPVPMPYAQLLPQLLAGQLIQLREMGPPPNPLPPGYDANARCEFHSVAPGHTIEKCRALKYKVQDLLDDKIISFAPTGPNVQNNCMPPHVGTTNAMESCDEQILVTDVNKVKMPLATVREHLVQQGILHELHDFCLQCSSNPEECAKLRDEIQKLMDEGILRVERVVSDKDVATLEIPYYPADVSKAQGTPLIIHASSTPLVIQAPRIPLVIQAPNAPLVIHFQAPSTSSPASSSVGDSKDVPWSYNDVYIRGKKHDCPPVGNLNVTNIAGTSGITRTGRIFDAPPPPPKETNKDVNAQTKGKQVVVDPPEPRTAQDAEQLLRIIKKSDYKVIDQLDQTQAKISILSLLVHSEAHRDALMKILASAHVTQDITVPQFEGIVVITGEEDLVINNLTTYRYVEVEGEVQETPFQALEIVSVDRLPVVENKRGPGAPLSSLNDAKAFLEAGVPHGPWGKLIDVYEKRDKYGLGYQPSSSTQFSPIHGKKVIPPISQVFVSANTSSEGQVLAVDDDDEEDLSRFICQAAPGQELSN
ncbi:uncharacterized protein LOC131637455 [Vicia villosa]|uniref:uncharacterized protein LOC131637455 n=1 Tax=Vicia villosa TaxID=3911 RepID=UPI00273CB0A4|nr:uncharacterized protein LOC131637455 [Vicia villosa]